MPLQPAALLAIHAEVRARFKTGLKSSNKRYVTDLAALGKIGGPMHGAGMRPVAPGGQHLRVVAGPVARATRNGNSVDAERLISLCRAARKKLGLENPYDRGRHALANAMLAGNCGEMAAAACYLVTVHQAGQAWLVSTDLSADHAFCLVTGGEIPQEKSVAAYRCGNPHAWVIDPWANVCCPMRDYERQFRAQMAHWARQGKLVAGPADAKRGPLGDRFILPTDALYMGRYMKAPLRIRKTLAPAATAPGTFAPSVFAPLTFAAAAPAAADAGNRDLPPLIPAPKRPR